MLLINVRILSPSAAQPAQWRVLLAARTNADLQHSSLTTHFSVSSVLSWHSEPSSGYCLTYRSLDLMPIPQDALQADQLIHSDIMQVDGSVGEETAQRKAPFVAREFPRESQPDCVSHGPGAAKPTNRK